MTASKIFFWFCIAFIIGIGISSFIKFSLPVLFTPHRIYSGAGLGFFTPHLFIGGGLILGLILISVFWSYKKIAVLGFCILFLVLGLWRYQSAELKIQKSELRKYNDTEEKITFIGTVVKESDIRETNTKLTIKINEVENSSRFVDEGRVLVTVGRYPDYQYGDKLKIIGQLKTPIEFEDFNYKDYLAKDKVYSVMYYPEVELVAKNQGSFIFSQILSFKNKLREVIYSNLSLPQSSILGAMILGDKSRMSDDLKEKLNRTGIRHITAISGLHISLVMVILMQILISIGLWRNQAFYGTLIILFLFILMIGFPASAVRAGIFGLMILLAQKVGRMKVASRVIVFSAVIMLVFNPLLLRLDVGFQLSFLAVIGIAYLGPVFNNWLKKIPNVLKLRSVLAMTLAAQVFTLPILIYNFGRFSLIAPATNILIVPLLSVVMIFGFVFVLLGAFWSGLGWIISLPVWLLLTYITGITNFFSQFSFSSIFLEIHWFWLVLAYIILVFLTHHLYRKATLPDYIY